MAIPEFLELSSEADYKQFFIENYCSQSPLFTWDGLPVMFFPEMFEHAFYKRAEKRWNAPKDSVDYDRCQRMPWIKDVLLDSSIIPHVGYDKGKGKIDKNSRVALVSKERYVVVIRNTGKNWKFVTAYLIDNDDTYNKITNSPVWRPSSCLVKNY